MSEVRAKFVDYKTSVGFWLYLMTDCILFASLFATYVVLKPAVANGPSAQDIFQLPLVLAETIILLTSSFTCGLALIALRHKNIKQLLAWMVVTYILGVSFLTIELTEFTALISEGHSWQQSAFLSGFFTLVGTHGLHIFFGLIWLLVLAAVVVKRGITPKVARQLGLFGMFWHFLDLVWIFIFTVVYLMGVGV
jgi:cytochrome o ubiquinol oxidase subunit III